MPRLTELNEVMFEVETRPVFIKLVARDVRVPDYQAVIECSTGRVLSVVGRDYRLVSHAEAFDLAFECARSAFPDTKKAEWAPAAVDGPSTGSTCYIDLAHNTAALDFTGLAASEKPEVYGPFVRVTNSYNRTRALRFDIGYYRKVCKNGLVLPDSLISFKMSHQRRDIGQTIQFNIDHQKLAKHRSHFLSFLDKLQKQEVPEAMMCPLVHGVLGFRPPNNSYGFEDPRQTAWRDLVKVVEDASHRYRTELGANANAVLNVVTEIASRPPLAVHRDRHTLQRRAGLWVSGFVAACVKEEFDLAAYLAELNNKIQDAGQIRPGVAVANA
jgi:hypothetical protein